MNAQEVVNCPQGICGGLRDQSWGSQVRWQPGWSQAQGGILATIGGYHMPLVSLQAADLKLSLARGAVGLEGTRGENKPLNHFLPQARPGLELD